MRYPILTEALLIEIDHVRRDLSSKPSISRSLQRSTLFKKRSQERAVEASRDIFAWHILSLRAGGAISIDGLGGSLTQKAYRA